MKLDPKRLMGLAIPPRKVAYDAREPMLYALAVGLAADPAASGELAFAYERSLRIVPSFANTLAFDDSWLETGGIELDRVVHGALRLEFQAPLPASAKIDVTSSIVGLSDKGEGRGGIVLHQTRIADEDGRPFCTSLSSLFVRGAGGFGGSEGIQPAPGDVPDRAPDLETQVTTTPNQALLFRLLGDRNPLHVDPAVATASGFAAPLLHGACTYGIACATLLRQFCGLSPNRLMSLEARFAGVVYPGETLRFSFWRDGAAIAFRAETVQRQLLVLDNGYATLRG